MPKIKIGDSEHEVSDALAPILNGVLTEHSKLLADSKSAIETLSKAKSDAEAKAKADADTATRKEVEAAAKVGDFDKAQKLADARVARIADGYRDDKLADLVRNHPKLRKDLDDTARAALVSDIVSALKPSAKFDLDARTLSFDIDGKSVDPSAHLDSFLNARPHYRAPDVKSGSGAGSQAGGKAGAPTKTAQEIVDMGREDPRAVARFFADGGVQV